MEALAVKYRPHTFEDVVSQESVVKILKRQVASRQFRNVFLFCGASGSGKTTCARIFANEINQHRGQPIEIDAASNSGVDAVKALVKSATERAIDCEYKIYIVDECHSITSQGWQAFLKCIEEPPTYTIFIFCTTDPQKIPDTILNRVMRFNFTKIPQQKIFNRLKYICNNEGFTNYEDSCDYISRICNGCMRDAITLLDKVSRYSEDISLDNTLNILGNFSYNTYFKLINATIDGEEPVVISIIEDIYNQGLDLKLFVDQYLAFNLDIMKYLLLNSIECTKIPNNMEDAVKNCVNITGAKQYYTYIVDKLLALKNMIKQDTAMKDTIEVMFLAMTRCV